MSIFKGDRVIRVDGTAVGFRRNETFEAVDVSRTHIKVKNAAGLISKWFERKDFQIWEQRSRRRELWTFVYSNRDGAIFSTSENSMREATAMQNYLLAQPGYSILAKKKITIPYRLNGAGL